MSLLSCLHSLDLQRMILSHLTLNEVQESIRKSCKECQVIAETYKAAVVETLSKKDTNVLILGLQSAEGKLLNGKVGKMQGVEKNERGRFSVLTNRPNWLAEGSASKLFKLGNIHPFFHLREKPKSIAPKELTEYTCTSNVLGSHGRLVHEALNLGRYHVNLVNSVFDFDGDINNLAQLPQGHPVVNTLNAKLFDYWDEGPFHSSRTVTKYGSTLDFIVGCMMMQGTDLESKSMRMARFDNLWPADGPQGKYMMRNLFQFLKSWKDQRVTAGFWVTDVYKTGTVMVSLSNIDDPESFSTVYLVKGHSSRIGDLVRRQGRLPGFCETTIFPIYDCWTYDGLIVPGRYNVSAQAFITFEQKLRDHVKKAIYDRTVSWRSPSAEQGLWDFEIHVPPLPTFRSNDGAFIVLDWHDDKGREKEGARAIISFEERELSIARNIARMALELGGTRKIGDVELPDESWGVLAMRRRGYSYQENPNGYCSMLDSRVEVEPIHSFNFAVNHDDTATVPTYSLCDALGGILAAMKKAKPRPLVTCIMIDEPSLLQPLDQIMLVTFEKVGLIPPEIEFL